MFSRPGPRKNAPPRSPPRPHHGPGRDPSGGHRAACRRERRAVGVAPSCGPRAPRRGRSRRGCPPMSEAQSLFASLRRSADPDVAAALERLVRDGTDRELCRLNVLDLAARAGLDEERAIAGFLHAARLGVLELAWNVLCPACGSVLDTNTTLRTVDKAEYRCGLCAADHEPTLDEMVEVTFTVSPRVRKIAAHDPDALALPEYCRQLAFGSGVDLPADLERVLGEVVLDAVELPPAERAILSLRLPAGPA